MHHLHVLQALPPGARALQHVVEDARGVHPPAGLRQQERQHLQRTLCLL
jgi:hypothetical protein